jgi:hypothetical protein
MSLIAELLGHLLLSLAIWLILFPLMLLVATPMHTLDTAMTILFHTYGRWHRASDVGRYAAAPHDIHDWRHAPFAISLPRKNRNLQFHHKIG